MDVQHVQAVVAADFRHPHRERQGVIGIFEQLIFVDHHRMKMQPRDIFRQTKWTLITDEMHFVSAPRQFFAQTRRQNAAPADGRITGNADFHSSIAFLEPAV